MCKLLTACSNLGVIAGSSCGGGLLCIAGRVEESAQLNLQAKHEEIMMNQLGQVPSIGARWIHLLEMDVTALIGS
jgi:hypothetical protein